MFSRSRFPKPVQHYTVLSFFGRNIVASEWDEWKKYRKITAPAFSDVSYCYFPDPMLSGLSNLEKQQVSVE